MNLKELRKKSGKTQFDVSVATGIQTSYMSRLENGVIENPRYSTLKKLADYFGVSVDSIVEEKK